MSGKLVVFEGIDGSGKSTQFKMICDRLSAEKVDFQRIVFPRYDKASSALIKMYLGGEFGTDPGEVNAYAASSFYAVDRYASFVQDWRGHYDNGALIMTDRYTSSNALHQGAKLKTNERRDFFRWLDEYEFDLIGLPRPDLTFYMNIEVSLASQRVNERSTQTDTPADIHEQDMEYLKSCAQSGMMAAGQYGWYVVDCQRDGKPRAADDIHNEVYVELRNLIDT